MPLNDPEQLELTVCPNCNTLYDPEQHTDRYTGLTLCPGCMSNIPLLE